MPTTDIHLLLEKYWGYTQFRDLQEDIIMSVLEGRDTLGLMPTGGGKSITFQIPTLAMDGLAIVVTPIISLMKDQVDNLVAVANLVVVPRYYLHKLVGEVNTSVGIED
jgi:ATP-dependent DNA helicase RecQ